MERLRGTAEEYLDLVRVLIVVLTPCGEVCMVNRWICAVLGYSPNEMVGRDWFTHFVPEVGRAEAQRNFRLLVEGKVESPLQRENFVQTSDGQLLRIDWNHNRIAGGGRARAVLSSGQDITEKYLLRLHLLRQQDEKRRELMHAVLQAADEERRQIARELHDGVNQVLTVCKLLVDADISAGHGGSFLEKVSGHLQEQINEIRNLAHRLNPAEMGSEGLYAAVKEVAGRINAAGTLGIEVKLGGARFIKHLPGTIALSLFRILQEALNNILKHASATVVQITLTGSKEAADMEIRDNGSGFRKSGARQGLGLRNIYTRAEAVGGKAFIASEPGEGTLLSVHIPFAGADRPST